MFRKLFFALFFLFSYASGANKNYNINEFFLKNGLHIVHVKKSTSPIVYFSILYMRGSKDEAISKSGVAHFLEHIAFCSDNGFFNIFLEKIGADRNAFTSLNAIQFYEIVQVEHIEEIFKHEAARIESLTPNNKRFITEKGAILEERSMRVDNNPNGQFGEIFNTTLFNRMPGGISVIGWKHEIQSITESDLKDFHNKWFCPNSAIIIIAGDIELDAVKRLAEKYFGHFNRKNLPKEIEPKINFDIKKEISFSSSKPETNFVIEYVYPVPFSVKSDFTKCLNLKIAIDILNQPEHQIEKILEDNINKDSSISIQYLFGYFPFDIVIVSIKSNSINLLTDCETIWNHVLKNKIANIKIRKEELDAIKRQKSLASAYRYDDIELIVNYFSNYLSKGLTVDQIKSIDEIVQSMSVEKCQNVLKEVFKNEPYAVFRMIPKGYDREQE